jgi:hypothetical protein
MGYTCSGYVLYGWMHWHRVSVVVVAVPLLCTVSAYHSLPAHYSYACNYQYNEVSFICSSGIISQIQSFWWSPLLLWEIVILLACIQTDEKLWVCKIRYCGWQNWITMENTISRGLAYWLAHIVQVVTSILPCILLQAVASRLCNPLWQRHSSLLHCDLWLVKIY